MNKPFRKFLYLFIFSVLGVFLFFIYNPTGRKQVELAQSIINTKVSQTPKLLGDSSKPPTIEKFTYTSTVDGKIEWSLTSISGTEAGGGDLINLESIDIVFYSSDGSQNNLKARTGSFNSSDSLVRLDGNIILMTEKGLRLEAESLDYFVKRRIVKTKESVSVHGTKFDIKGTGLEMNIDSGDFEIKNNVSGGFMYGFL